MPRLKYNSHTSSR